MLNTSSILTLLLLQGDSYSQAALHSHIIILEMKHTCSQPPSHGLTVPWVVVVVPSRACSRAMASQSTRSHEGCV